jgi:fibrillarin-like pre-rRNA processing protein
MEISKEKESNFFWITDGKKQLATLNLVPGYAVYGERLVKSGGKEYRLWDPYRSKIGAALMRGMTLPIKEGDSVLYLGAASGTTASHVSDIVGSKGRVFCVDIAERVMRDLIFVCEKKKNMIPVLADATKPESYVAMVGKVDFVFADVAMPNQAELLISNCKRFLKKDSFAMISVKSRSIDVTAEPKKIYAEVEAKLSKEFKIIDKKELKPYEMDHIMFLLKF